MGFIADLFARIAADGKGWLLEKGPRNVDQVCHWRAPHLWVAVASGIRTVSPTKVVVLEDGARALPRAGADARWRLRGPLARLGPPCARPIVEVSPDEA
eukprot:gene36202-18296_t